MWEPVVKFDLSGNKCPEIWFTFLYLTKMRNFFIGLFLGVSLATGIAATASTKGPRLLGASGRLHYAVAVDGEMMCTDPWVSVPDRVIECDAEPDDGADAGSPLVAE